MSKLATIGRRMRKADAGNSAVSADLVSIAAFSKVLKSGKLVVVGRQGTGKSTLCSSLERSGGALFRSSLVTPDEMSRHALGPFRRLEGYSEEEAMFLYWRYVLAVQIARHTVVHAHAHRKRRAKSVQALRGFLEKYGGGEEPEHPNQLSQLAQLLFESLTVGLNVGVAKADVTFKAHRPEAASPGDGRVSLPRFAEDLIRQAESELNCTSAHPSLLILADELERVWTGDEQSNATVAGLLRAALRAEEQFPGVRCRVFLPDSIYNFLRFGDLHRFRGYETRLNWTEDNLRELARALGRPSPDPSGSPEWTWEALAASTINNEPAVDYLISRTLHRPSDLRLLALLCEDAMNRHGRAGLLPEVVTEAEAEFSRLRLADLAAEYRTCYPFLGDLCGLFRDTGYAFSRQRIDHLLGGQEPALRERFADTFPHAGLPALIQILYDVSFLGVRDGPQIRYSYQSIRMIERSDQEFYVHPGFHPALGLTAGSSMQLYGAASAEGESEVSWDESGFRAPVAGSVLSRPAGAGGIHRIGLWGAAGSGKTTFLAAIPVAAVRAAARPMICGASEAATNFLTEASRKLNVEGEFPEPTEDFREIPLTLCVPPAPSAGRSGPLATPGAPARIDVEILDFPGAIFAAKPWGDYPGREAGGAMEDLAACGGLIYFLDLEKELGAGGSYADFEHVLLRMAQLWAARSHTQDLRLPHYLAVCATKYDAQAVYPVVNRIWHAGEDPGELFARLNQMPSSRHGRGSDTADLIPAAISRYFLPERVRYFVTSAVGFWNPSPDGKLDHRDFTNVREPELNRAVVRGAIRPIGVAEPLLWLGEKLAARKDIILT